MSARTQPGEREFLFEAVLRRVLYRFYNVKGLLNEGFATDLPQSKSNNLSFYIFLRFSQRLRRLPYLRYRKRGLLPDLGLGVDVFGK